MRELLRDLAQDTETGVNRRPPAHLAYLNQLLREFSKETKRLGELSETPSVPAGRALLTVKEREVMTLLEQGLSYEEMAQHLSITENTLKTHIKHLYTKLKARNRTEAGLNLRKLQRDDNTFV